MRCPAPPEHPFPSPPWRLLASLALLLGATLGLAAATVATPVIPVRLSWVVADFRWNLDPGSPSPAAGMLDGAVMDNSDALSLRQEIVLPGVIWQDSRQLVIGVQWYWADLKHASVRLEALPPQSRPVPLQFVGMDEGYGLLILEPGETGSAADLKGIRVPRQNLAANDTEHRLICSPEVGTALRFWAAAVSRPGELQPMSTAHPEPMLAPVFTLGGEFDGFTFPAPGPAAAGRPWKHLSAAEVEKRVGYIVKNRQDLTAGYLGVFFGGRDDAAEAGPVFVREIVPGSPAAIAGLQQGDVIRKIERQPVRSLPEAIGLIRLHSPNSQLDLEILRDGTPLSKQVILGQKPARNLRKQPALPPLFDEPGNSYVTSLSRYAASQSQRSGQAIPTMGTFIRPASAELLRQLGGSGDGGVLVAMVLPGYPAAQAGLRAGDLLLEIQGRPATAVPEVNEILKSCQKNQTITVRYLRNGQSRLTRLVLR